MERYVSLCDHVKVGQYSHNCMNCENYIGIILSVQLWHQMIAVCSCQLIFHQLHHRQISSFAFQCSLLVRSMNAGSLDVRSVFAWSQSFSTILQYLITCLHGMTIYKNVNGSSSISITYYNIGCTKTANFLHNYQSIKCIMPQYCMYRSTSTQSH